MDDVSHVLRFASANGLRVAPQTTAHGAGGLGDLSGSLLLRTSETTGATIFFPFERSSEVLHT